MLVEGCVWLQEIAHPARLAIAAYCCILADCEPACADEGRDEALLAEALASGCGLFTAPVRTA